MTNSLSSSSLGSYSLVQNAIQGIPGFDSLSVSHRRAARLIARQGMCSADATENPPHHTEVPPQALLLLPKSVWGLISGGNPALPRTGIQPFLMIEGRNYFVGA